MFVNCLLILLGFACFGAFIAACMKPLNGVRVGTGFVQCGLSGLWFAIGWWLASITPSNILFRYLLDGIVGFIVLSAILHALWTLFSLKTSRLD